MRNFVGRTYRTARAVSSSYGRHAGSQLAAGLSYRVLFSLVPLLALTVSVIDLLLPSETRKDVVDWLFRRFPGHELESAVNKSVSHPGATAPVVGLVALAGLLWAASGMMASIRVAFRVVWEVPGPTYVRGKVRDLLLVALAAALLLVAFGVSLVAQLVAEAGKGVSDAVGLQSDTRVVDAIVQLGGGLLVGFLALIVLYWVVPPVRMGFRQVWPSAALAAVAIELLIKGFAFYAARTTANSVYGPLGAVFTFLLLIYLLGTVLLLGAELTATGSATPRGEMKLFRRGSKKRKQDVAVYHIASMLDEGVMSVDQLLAPGIWEDFPGDPADVDQCLRQVADDPKTSDADRGKIGQYLEQLHDTP
ncbi:MAG: YihY/virulence factor BrkB family protein [Solirubrobacterales bacterium]